MSRARPAQHFDAAEQDFRPALFMYFGLLDHFERIQKLPCTTPPRS